MSPIPKTSQDQFLGLDFSYSKTTLVTATFEFCVITFEPIEVQTCSAPQNDRLNLVFVKDIKVDVEKMTRNRHKMIGKTGDSLVCTLHSIQVLPRDIHIECSKQFK